MKFLSDIFSLRGGNLDRNIGGFGLLFLQTIEHQFHASGNPKLIEDSKKIVTNDSGSTVLGFVAAFLCLDFYRTNASANSPSILIFPFLAAALPLLDTLLSVLRRLSGQISPTHGDRRHFYDLLLALGWPSKKVALACYALTAALCFIAWLGLQLKFAMAVLLDVLTVGVLVYAAVRLGSLRTKESKAPMIQAQTSYSR
jgi:hypothetical protein